MFTTIILTIIGDGVDHSSTTDISTQLLHSEKMTFKINNKDVVTEANSLKACENVDPGATAIEKVCHPGVKIQVVKAAVHSDIQ